MIIALLAFAAVGNDSAMMLFLCIVLAIVLVAYTFHVPPELAHGTEKTRLAFLRERKEQVYENLRDLNFEFKAGKFPDADYQQMRGSLEDEAAALLAEIERLESSAAAAYAASLRDSVKPGVLKSSKGARS
jgi:hypothetical protein